MEARARRPENPIDEENIMKHPRMKRAALWLLTLCLSVALTGVNRMDAAAAETAGQVVGKAARMCTAAIPRGRKNTSRIWL